MICLATRRLVAFEEAKREGAWLLVKLQGVCQQLKSCGTPFSVGIVREKGEKGWFQGDAFSYPFITPFLFITIFLLFYSLLIITAHLPLSFRFFFFFLIFFISKIS
jgi:hypothetical protein